LLASAVPAKDMRQEAGPASCRFPMSVAQKQVVYALGFTVGG
jgi:hypothetical protein